MLSPGLAWRRLQWWMKDQGIRLWHEWIVADDEYSALLDRWDLEARGRVLPPGNAGNTSNGGADMRED